MVEITIRKMHKDDLPAVSEMSSLANPHATKEEYSKLLERELEANPDLSFVATHNGSIIGYVQAEARKGKQAIPQDIAVSKKFQGKNVGTRLLNKTIEAVEANGARMMFAEAHYKCAAAIPFYYRHGFRISGFSQDHFGIGHDAIILKRELHE
jgi:ribosomal protein S18 acetylase RimI-like enzyme